EFEVTSRARARRSRWISQALQGKDFTASPARRFFRGKPFPRECTTGQAGACFQRRMPDCRYPIGHNVLYGVPGYSEPARIMESGCEAPGVRSPGARFQVIDSSPNGTRRALRARMSNTRHKRTANVIMRQMIPG